MDVENQLNRHQAELFALQVVLIGLCKGLARIGPSGKIAVDEAFRYAESASEAFITQSGSPDFAEYLTRVAEVIEQIRAASVQDKGQPKGGV